MSDLHCPFPYFGGKRKVGSLVWERFGNTPNYVEPFAGSLAVLLARPSAARTETVNDLDAHLSNFWRAIQYDPAAVAHYADWPVNEVDLHARHLWLVTKGKERIAQLKEDPEFYDAQVAGWWVWGICAWIGDGWCRDLDKRRPHIATSGNGVHSIAARPPEQLPTAHGTGIHQKAVQPKQQRPNLIHNGAGVHAQQARENAPREISPVVMPEHLDRLKLEIKRPQLMGGERGVHSAAVRVPARKPRVGSRSNFGLHAVGKPTDLAPDETGSGKGDGIRLWFEALSERLRYTRVCCGDWSRIVTPAVTTTNGLTAVFLDPPYDMKRRDRCYTHDAVGIAEAVRVWAIENGNNPLLRIALCGYVGEHEMPAGWDCVAWRTGGGYGNIGQGRGRDNADKERIWFSPHCLRPGLFSEHQEVPLV